MPQNRAILLADGLSHPAYLERRPYWTRPELAGRFHPNPYYPPLDTVQVETAQGAETRRVTRAPVEPEFAHYPQYRDGFRSRVEA